MESEDGLNGFGSPSVDLTHPQEVFRSVRLRRAPTQQMSVASIRPIVFEWQCDFHRDLPYASLERLGNQEGSVAIMLEPNHSIAPMSAWTTLLFPGSNRRRSAFGQVHILLITFLPLDTEGRETDGAEKMERIS